MLELERRRLTTVGKSAALVNTLARVLAEFHLIKGMTPGQILAQPTGSKEPCTIPPTANTTAPFYQPLQELKLGQIGQNVNARC